MASRYHWITAGFFTSTQAGNNTLPDCQVTIPAGGTLKRFMVNGPQFMAFYSGNDVNKIQNVRSQFNVTLGGGQYAGREIFSCVRAHPQQVVGIYDSSQGPGFGRVYSQWQCVGQLELGFNEKCSYGLATGPSFTVTLASRILTQNGQGPLYLLGNYGLTFRCLYYL